VLRNVQTVYRVSRTKECSASKEQEGDWGKPRNPPVMIAVVSAENRTRFLMIVRLDCYRSLLVHARLYCLHVDYPPLIAGCQNESFKEHAYPILLDLRFS
jgi:hypothetical protein